MMKLPFTRPPSWCLRVLLMLFGSFLVLTLTGCQEKGVLFPEGYIADQEKQLLYDAVALMLIVVIPVIIMSFAFVYHYRAKNKTKDYKPNWSHSVFLESIWWGVPCAIILTLGILTWKKSHQLDPYRPIAGAGKPLLIKVVALPWKWLFIYPKQNIATVNELVLPRNTQIEFWLTSDNVPMSAFFIPRLGSQIYTMAGMRTRIHLIGNTLGTIEGMNAQYNGEGFSKMKFPVRIVTREALDSWFKKVKQSPTPLNEKTYASIVKPSIGNKPSYYAGVDQNLFMNIIKKYHVANIIKRSEDKKD